MNSFWPVSTALVRLAICLCSGIAGPAATITNYAGGGGTDADNLPTTNSLLLGMEGLALDPSGDIFIARDTGARSRRVEHATGIISASAGLVGDYGFSGDGGPTTEARVGPPMSVATDLSPANPSRFFRLERP